LTLFRLDSPEQDARVRFTEPQRIVVVANPKSRVSPDMLETLVRAYMPPGSYVTVRLTKPDTPIHGIIEDELDTATLAIASGGDGTVSQVAGAILDARIPLGIVPAGSTNMVAKVSGVPSDAEMAVRLIFGDHRRELIDVGRSGERLLMHLGGSGIDARIFLGANSELKRHLRWLAYVPPALSSAFAGQSLYTVTVDGAVTQARSSLVLVANSAQLLSPRIHLVEDVSRVDGKFDVLIYTATNPFSLAIAGVTSLTGRLETSGQVIRLRGKNIRIEAEPPAPTELDGEVVGETPLEIEVLPRAIELIRG
jgi:diacylglycerol kinase family enzyme